MSTKVILHGVTAPMTALSFLRGQLGHLTSAGWETHLVCPDDPAVRQMCKDEGTTFHAVPLSRTPSLWRDLGSVLRIFTVVGRVRPDVVVAGTPKISLLLLLVAWGRRVERRVYLCHGLRFEGASGVSRTLLTALERLLAGLATDVVPVSPSVQEGLALAGVPPERMTLMGSGSPNGVDTDAPYPIPPTERATARRNLGLDDAKPTVLFLGRLTHDKGLHSLLHVAQELDDLEFIVAGGSEPRDLDDRVTINSLFALPNVHNLGHQHDVRPLYAASDILLLPTKREGLPTVVLEAAAAGVPTVAYAVTGTVDAIAHDETGVLIPHGEVDSLTSAVHQLATGPDLRHQLGSSARRDVVNRFSQEHVWNHWLTFLDRRRPTP